MIGTCHHTKVIDWDGALLTFCLGLHWTMILLMSAS
jgi:hypothetical protein